MTKLASVRLQGLVSPQVLSASTIRVPFLQPDMLSRGTLLLQHGKFKPPNLATKEACCKKHGLSCLVPSIVLVDSRGVFFSLTMTSSHVCLPSAADDADFDTGDEDWGSGKARSSAHTNGTSKQKRSAKQQLQNKQAQQRYRCAAAQLLGLPTWLVSGSSSGNATCGFWAQRGHTIVAVLLRETVLPPSHL